MRQFKIIVEKHPNGYVAYPLGLKGVVVGDGNTYDEALADVKSAIQFHIETFCSDVLPGDSPIPAAFIAEANDPPHNAQFPVDAPRASAGRDRAVARIT